MTISNYNAIMITTKSVGGLIVLFFQVLDAIEDENERIQLQKLFEEHAKRIKLYIKNHFSLSAEEIDDAVGDVFQKIISERKEILHVHPDIQIKQMLLITRRICLNKRKRNTLELNLFTSLDEIKDNSNTFDMISSDNHDFTVDIAEKEVDSQNIRFIIDFISKMDKTTSTIFLMKFAYHKSNVEIAKILHMNASTVGTILNRTITKIRKALGIS